ncbi:MAG: hypothetical protein J7M19_08795 [Planctomycetes bacterium]|nr:hypothetical protein [Planctomycetota bacterium]
MDSKMSPRERMDVVLAGKPADRVPFVPAIYEHKAALIGRPPSQVAQDERLLADAVIAEYETYNADLLTVGIDVYNIEPEALGARVRFLDDNSAPEVEGTLIGEPEEAADLDSTRIATRGRAPLVLEAARLANETIGDEVYVRVAVSGPATLASKLLGSEKFIILAAMEPERARGLLDFCAGVAFDYARAARQTSGCGVVVFDSQAAPPLLSPGIFESLIVPVYKELFFSLRNAGEVHLPLVIGGDTTPVLESYLATTATQILCDWPADTDVFIEKCSKAPRPWRKNVDPVLASLGPAEKIADQARAIMARCSGVPGFILGTGIVAYDTPVENVLAARSAAWTP